MCSIIGYFNFEKIISKTIKSLEILKHRGKNNYGLYFNKKTIFSSTLEDLNKQTKNLNKQTINFTFAHNLFPLVNNIKQPFKKKGLFITNCEIYNWKELNSKYNLGAKNDAELLFLLIEKKGIKNSNDLNKILKELDGVYAFAYLIENKLILVRDILGIKPLFLAYKKGNSFAFASERKALKDSSFIGELDPQKILEYDLKTKKITLKTRDFFSLEKELNLNYSQIKQETKEFLFNAIKKRVPDTSKKIGVLFSGGIDSTFIVIVLKQLNIPFSCYTAKIEGGNIEEAEDLIYAKEIAKKHNLDLKIISIKTKELESTIIKIMGIIEDSDYIKVSVALPFYLSCIKAKEDGVEVIFSGLGSEEIFAGYNRHRKTDNINKECLNGLEILFYRDLYRDDTITMSQTIELRLPFLDKDLINYALKIPPKYKINLEEKRNKIILRDIAYEIGIEKRYSERPKKAAQYGSKFDKGILRLAKDKKVSKQEYLNRLFNGHN